MLKSDLVGIETRLNLSAVGTEVHHVKIRP